MAKKEIEITKLSDYIYQKINTTLESISKTNPDLTKALVKIGFILETEMKLSIRRLRIIDTGNLLNKTTFDIFKEKNKIGVKVGTFGVHYAKYHELGSKFTHANLRAMFWAKKKAGEHKRKFEDKNVVDLDMKRLKKRPYIAPSLAKKRNRVLQIIKDVYKFK